MSALSTTAACILLPQCRAPLGTACRPQRIARAVRRAAHVQRRTLAAASARSDDEVEPVPPALVSALSSEDELLEEAEWLAGMIRSWANEEWAAAELLEVHAQLGAAVGQAYLKLRRQEGVAEMGDLVLGLATELMAGFDFMPTFTSAFEASNKAVELLMQRGGINCSCGDPGAIARYEAALAAEGE